MRKLPLTLARQRDFKSAAQMGRVGGGAAAPEPPRLDSPALGWRGKVQNFSSLQAVQGRPGGQVQASNKCNKMAPVLGIRY
jgi:hypothetical protein